MSVIITGAAAAASGVDFGALARPGAQLALPLQLLILMTGLTVLPTLLLMMTGFTRILIVLSILRQALGLQQTPPNQILVGLSLFLTLFVMRPALTEIDRVALQPARAGTIAADVAIVRGGNVLHGFMARQTRKADLTLFATLGDAPPVATIADTPFSILVPAFVTSELKTAFQIGFMIYLPFLIIALVVASALMALGMMMLSPSVVSLPFKLLLFVAIDGWALTMGSLARSFA
jgi:flagellar biosynthetic protein FliP